MPPLGAGPAGSDWSDKARRRAIALPMAWNLPPCPATRSSWRPITRRIEAPYPANEQLGQGYVCGPTAPSTRESRDPHSRKVTCWRPPSSPTPVPQPHGEVRSRWPQRQQQGSVGRMDQRHFEPSGRRTPNGTAAGASCTRKNRTGAPARRPRRSWASAQCLSASGTLPPFSASLIMTCLCSHTFMAALSLVLPV